METHGVSRLVCETSLGIGDSAGRMGLDYMLFVIPAILPFYFWDKARQERIVAAFMLDQLTSDESLHTAIGVCGRRDEPEGETSQP